MYQVGAGGGIVNEEVLEAILRKEREKYHEEWKRKEKAVFQNIEKLRNLAKKDHITEEDIKRIHDDAIEQLKSLTGIKILWTWGGKDAKIEEFLNRQEFKTLLSKAEGIKNVTEAEELQKLFIEVTQGKHTKLSTVSSWLCVMNPQVFYPMHAQTIPKQLREKLGLNVIWGGKTNERGIKEYLTFLKILERINKKLGIETMIESAFYLSRFKGSDDNGKPPKRTTLRKYLSYKGYLYPLHLVSQFYTALKTKGFVILSGLTGTGKTKIAQELAELLDGSKNNLLFLSVRPDWRDSKALLGYYNPLTGEYHKTSLLEFILRAKEDYEQNREKAMPYFIILDEMNLAHVEYYFADFLSVLESGRDNDGFTKESIKLHDNEEVEIFQGIPKELKLPPNLYIIGTVNMDETTYSFSPKVLDRAFVVEFHDVELEEYPPERIKLSEEEVGKLRNAVLDDLRGENGKFLARSKEEINKAVKELKDTEHWKVYWEVLVELNKALEPYDMHFGYRVVDEIALFFQSAKESQDKGIVEFKDDDEIFDLALLMKVLPKFHGNRKKLEEPLKAVLKLCLSESAGINVQELRKENVIELLKNWETQKENFRFKHTARKVLHMLRQLYEIGFASFS
ncbi:MAG: AAA family ATPase [Thermococcus sp.]|nr:AAA family ATPase [Thermococcus sp.]